MDWLGLGRWSPYVVGIGIGILSWVSFLVSDRTIGCSTAFARTSGMIERLLVGSRVTEKPYYKRYAPVIDWQWMLVAGVVIGSLVSSLLSGQFSLRWVPALWTSVFSAAPVPRLLVAFVGGVLMGLGSRWAGGCTSGHGISGTLQLTVSSWLAAISFFAGGIAAAMLIYRVLA